MTTPPRPRHLQLADPLPECLACEEPTRRETHQRTGGLCSGCHRVVQSLRVQR